MDALLFSVYLPDQSILPDHEKSDRIYIGAEFLKCFEENFKDADVYVGINPGTDKEFITLLESYKDKFNNLEYVMVPREQYSRSDASGYQAALKLLKNSGKKYDFVWFGHTKGGHYNDIYRAECRKFMIDNFFGKRLQIQNLLSDHEESGVFGNVITVTMPNKNNVYEANEFLNDYYDFKYECTELAYLYTFYTIKGFIVDEFINNCNDLFWENTLGKYFFEECFPHIATRMGYEQLYEFTQNFPRNNIVDDTRVEKIKATWRRKYGL